MLSTKKAGCRVRQIDGGREAQTHQKVGHATCTDFSKLKKLDICQKQLSHFPFASDKRWPGFPGIT